MYPTQHEKGSQVSADPVVEVPEEQHDTVPDDFSLPQRETNTLRSEDLAHPAGHLHHHRPRSPPGAEPCGLPQPGLGSRGGAEPRGGDLPVVGFGCPGGVSGQVDDHLVLQALVGVGPGHGHLPSFRSCRSWQGRSSTTCSKVKGVNLGSFEGSQLFLFAVICCSL